MTAIVFLGALGWTLLLLASGMFTLSLLMNMYVFPQTVILTQNCNKISNTKYNENLMQNATNNFLTKFF